METFITNIISVQGFTSIIIIGFGVLMFKTEHFKNKGRFVTLNEGKKTLLNFEWLESAYMVRVDGKLKIKFYFSDAVDQSSEAID